MSIRARMFAEKTLIKAGITRLPILSKHIQEYLEAEGWEFISYSLDDEKSLKLLNKLNLLDHAKHNPGFSYCNGDTRIIFYRSDLSEKEKVIVFAHELGHIKIGHLSSFGALGYDAGFITKPQEDEANDFAVEFLAPTYVLNQLHVNTISDVQKYTLLDANHCGTALSNVQTNEPNAENNLEVATLFKAYIKDIHKGKHKQKLLNSLWFATPIAIIILSMTLLAHNALFNKRPDNVYQTPPAITTTPMPSDIPETSIPNTTGNVVVTSTGKKYHLPDCRFVKDKTNTRTLSIEDAVQEGYAACDVCDPDKR